MNNSILLVDDVRMYLEIEKDFLKYSMLDILTAKDGVEALNILQTKRPEMIFMDLEMPNMNGATACRAIKGNPSFRNTPVVIVTAVGNEESKKSCYSAGCDHLLSKPLDRDAFLNVARKFIPSIDRREIRVSVKIDCTFRCQNETVSGYLSDLSCGGAFVVADYAVPPGSVVQISFFLPDGTFVDCPGRIAWINRLEAKAQKGFGVKFALMAKEAKNSLNRFLGSVQTVNA